MYRAPIVGALPSEVVLGCSASFVYKEDGLRRRMVETAKDATGSLHDPGVGCLYQRDLILS